MIGNSSSAKVELAEDHPSTKTERDRETNDDDPQIELGKVEEWSDFLSEYDTFEVESHLPVPEESQIRLRIKKKVLTTTETIIATAERLYSSDSSRVKIFDIGGISIISKEEDTPENNRAQLLVYIGQLLAPLYTTLRLKLTLNPEAIQERKEYSDNYLAGLEKPEHAAWLTPGLLDKLRDILNKGDWTTIKGYQIMVEKCRKAILPFPGEK